MLRSLFLSLTAASGIAICMLSPCSAQSPASGSQMVDNRAIIKYVNDTDIPAQSDGLITSISIDEGFSIAMGETLIELDTRLALAELKVAQKEYEAALEKAKNTSNIEFNELSYTLAKKVSENHRELLLKGATSRGEYDKILLEEDKARLAGVVSELEQRTNQLTSEVSKAKVAAAQVQLELRQIKAPFDGIVAERKKQPNDYVRVGEKIIRLVGMDRLHVIGSIRSKDIVGPPHMLERAPATAIITLFPATATTAAREYRVDGNLTFVSPVQREDGSYRVKMEIANIKDGSNWVLRDGMTATLVVHGGMPETSANAPNTNLPGNRR